MAKKIILALLMILSISTLFLCASILVVAQEPYQESMDLVGDYNQYQRKWMNEAWNMSHNKEFMYMLKAENGTFNHDRIHDPSNNVVGVDWGFCGTNDHYHADIVNNPLFFSDPMWQLEQCYEMYLGGTTFHGLKRVNDPEIQSHFIFF